MVTIEAEERVEDAMRRSERGERDPDLGVLSARLLFAVQDELFGTLARQGHPGLRPRHGAVLAHLDPEGGRATDLARRSGRTKQVVGRLLDELEALGYVERRPHPADRRAKLVVPTARGLDQMAKADAIMASIERRHADALGPDGYRDFKRALREAARRQRAADGPAAGPSWR
ncbi:MarR family winged helix-turn-helix transcriptional regulator [Allonocardiopsis opalescens]|uniref:MarR family transcriptional regulator n=1 Tax=Allonocardiopsis opalescens TaxID=1144618 RepID=A0A2T0Q212_9ACTN|nr:MarR family winged helix-turn-helix transcriptional regulator [Allonocardiopsis opalescens]PRX97750.1 MarR family transcriptional regulator [Allonocardiopsis opalescens]